MNAGEGLTVYVPFARGYFEFPQDYGKYFEQGSRFLRFIGFIAVFLKDSLFLSILVFFVVYFSPLLLPLLFMKWYRNLELGKKLDKTRWYHINLHNFFLNIFRFLLFSYPFPLFFWIFYFNRYAFEQFSLIVFVSIVFCISLANFDKFWDFEYNGKKPLIPYYLPPKDLDIYALFAFSVKHGLSKDFVAPIFLYWASQEKITISYKERSVDLGLF